MNASGSDPNQGKVLHEQVAGILASAWTLAQQGSASSLSAERLLRSILKTGVQQEDYVAVEATVQSYLQAVHGIENTLETVLKRIDTLKAPGAIQQRGHDDRWWQEEQQTLHFTFLEEPNQALNRWLQLYAEALIEWKLDVCNRLVQEPYHFPQQTIGLIERFRRGTRAITDKHYEQALEMLEYLTQPTLIDESQPRLDHGSRATILTFMGRIHLYQTSNFETALRYFEEAKQLDPDDGRPYAGLGDYYRARGEEQLAEQLYRRAVEVTSSAPEGYIGLGLLLEEESRWEEADDEYREAIIALQAELGVKDVSAALGRLLAPVSGNVYLQLARMLRKDDAENAITAVERAMSIGIRHEGAYPERIAFRVKADILKSLGRLIEAAENYFEAGCRFLWREEYLVAVDLFMRVREMDPDKVPTYWYLSESLRMSSFLPESPYVNWEFIWKSLAVWEEGAQREYPNSDYAWAYLARASISAELRYLPDADDTTLLWQAIAFVERAILLDEAYTDLWAYLGQYHGTLSNEANALHATGTALANSPEEIGALSARAVILANIGQIAEAQENIDKLRELEPSSWADAVKAFILVAARNYQEALRLVENAVEDNPRSVWIRETRATCNQRLGDEVLAAQDYQWIWECREDPSYAKEKISIAWAAYQLGKIEEAIGIYTELLDDPLQSNDAHRHLGLCYLKRGDLNLGTKQLNKGIERTNNTVKLSHLCIELEDLSRITTESSNGPLIHDVIEQMNEKIKLRKEELQSAEHLDEMAAQRELEKIVKLPEHGDGKPSWPWVGAHAGLARLHNEQGQWNEAAKSYRLLLTASDLFPEARIGLERIIAELQGEGDQHLHAGRVDDALKQFTHAVSLVNELGAQQMERHAALQGRLGYARFKLGDVADSRTDFVQAMRFYREADRSNPGEALGTMCRSLLRDTTDYWTLESQWQEWAATLSAHEPLRMNLSAARKALAEYLNERYQLYADTDEPRVSMTLPIVLEVGQDLVPRVDSSSDGGQFLYEDIPAMRQRIDGDIGVTIPGVRARTYTDASAPNRYRISINEIPIDGGTVQVGLYYCLASTKSMSELGIPEDAFIQTPDPLTGELGYWVQQEHRDRVVGEGIELLTDTNFIIRHLEDTLRQHIANFLGIEEVAALLSTWEESDPGSRLVEVTLPDQASRVRFARLLRALVRENVSITSWADILDTIQRVGLASDNLAEALRAIRLRLRSFLPGNNSVARRVHLPASIEDMIAALRQQESGSATFVHRAEATRTLLSSLRDLVGASDRNVVLIINNFKLRPFLNELVRYEFPHLMVLAQEELLSQDESVEAAQAENVAERVDTND